jgi:regulator of sigma E protease
VVLLAIIGLGLIIFVHEFGHFMAGKLMGIKVKEFMFGLPSPPIFSFKIGETKYGLTSLPFGGYVRFAGRESELSFWQEEVKEPPEETYDAQPLWRKAIIIFSGPLLNLIFPVLVVALILTFQGAARPTTTVGRVISNMPAEKVGIKAGDQILSFNNTKVKSWPQLIKLIQKNPAKKVKIVVKRNGERLTVYPKLKRKDSRGFLGIETKIVYKRENPIVALYHGGIFVYDVTVWMVKTLYYFITKNAAELVRQSRGPVGIVYEITKIANRSLSEFIIFLAFLSLNIGIVNLIPIPPLDGGRLALLGVEGIKGSPINRRFLLAINAAGMALLLTLMVYLVVADIGRILAPAFGS